MRRPNIMHHLPPSYMLGYIAICFKDYQKTNLGLLHYLALNSLATFLHLSPFWQDCRFLTAFSSQPYFVLCSLWLISQIIEKQTGKPTLIIHIYIYFLRNSFSYMLLNFLPIEETPTLYFDTVFSCMTSSAHVSYQVFPLSSLCLSHTWVMIGYPSVSVSLLDYPSFNLYLCLHSACLVLFIRWLMSHRSLSLSLGKVTGRNELPQYMLWSSVDSVLYPTQYTTVGLYCELKVDILTCDYFFF